ncbi:MAG: hypothetical protein RR983_02625, partial [Massilia sp.]
RKSMLWSRHCSALESSPLFLVTRQMTAQKQIDQLKRDADAYVATDLPLRSPEEKARILARLQCMLAQLRASNGADHGNT